ncbi:MAG TPA: ABC transporter permease, partial [Gemmatimonadaceae bacterium]|nr:ABC transporter permease [Gemmatimonadaceae bacterium]
AAHWDIFRQDLAYTARTLRNARGFAIAAILVTALGVGANTATFSVADFVLLRPLPFKNPDRLVRLCEGPKDGGGWGCMNQLSPANYRDVANGVTTSVESWGAFTGLSANLVGRGEPIRINGALVTPSLLHVLGVAPIRGRAFENTPPAEPPTTEANTVVLSYGLWQSHFGGDENIIGTQLQLDGAPYTVIGVMPSTFRFPSDEAQLWMPLPLPSQVFQQRDNNYLDAVGRLREGSTFEQARAEIAAIFTRMQRDYPDVMAETGFSFFRQQDYVMPRNRLIILALCGASLSMLLLTCANLANLLLARAAARERELAVRAALGAGRDRLVRQMLTESVILALLGGLAGVGAAALAMPLLQMVVPQGLPLAEAPTLDGRVLALAGIFTALTGLGFGLIPALRAGGATGFSALREGTRAGAGRQRLRAVLVAVEIAVSVMLLISSGLFIRAISRVQAVDPGFKPDGVVTMRTTLPVPKYAEPEPRAQFYDRVLNDVRALPGVEQAAYVSGVPMVLWGGIAGIEIPGRPVVPSRRQGVAFRLASAQYFGALGIPLRRGRDLEDADTPDRQLVAVVSESFVQEYWPGEDGLGKTFIVRDQLRTVVGVVGDVKTRGLERTNEPQVYIPARQPPEGGLGGLYVPKDLVIRAPTQGLSIVPAVREAVRRADAEQPIADVRMMADVLDGQFATRNAQIRILGALAVLALLLCAVGIHGLLAFTVAQRGREIGVRLALGAEPRSVAGMVVGDATRMALFGVVPGVFGAYLAARAMSALLFGVDPGDPWTLGAAAAVCMATAIVAALRPAMRAARVDPITALKTD